MVVLFEPDKIYAAHRFLQHKPTAQDLVFKKPFNWTKNQPISIFILGRSSTALWIYRAEALCLLGVEKQMVISLEAKFTCCLLGFTDCPEG